MKKIVLLSIALITAGFIAATAQDNISILPTIKKTNSGQDWWEPDTISVTYLYTNSWEDNLDRRFIHKYNSQGLLKEYIEQRVVNNLNSWRNDNQITYTYDTNNNRLTELKQVWSNNLWENNYQVTYTYDANNNRLTQLFQGWRDNSWGNNNQTTYTYDSNNNLLTQLNQRWENNSWENNNQTTYTYDTNNNLLTQLNQTWENNSWRNDNQITYTYDSNNNILTRLNHIQTPGNYYLVDRFLSTYTYDDSDHLLTLLEERSKNNLLVSRALVIYTYDSNNNKLTELCQGWKEDNSWVNITLITYTYNSNNNRLTQLNQIWINNSWVNDAQFLMTYDENGNGISTEFWQQIGESLQPSNEPTVDLRLYYNNRQSYFQLNACHKLTASSYIKVSDLTAIADPPATPELSTISIYPNPTTEELKIENGEWKIQQISFFDIAGVHLFDTQQTTLDVSHLPAGIYFVQIKTEKGTVTKKVVKL